VEYFTRAESEQINRHRRTRQWAIVAAVILIILLFYSITIVKLGRY
jgi:hypothetical protein